jgi:hypothetical protein
MHCTVPTGLVGAIPKGLKDSARGFNPGSMHITDPPYKGGRQFVPDVVPRHDPFLPPLQVVFASVPGVKTPGSVLLSLRDSSDTSLRDNRPLVSVHIFDSRSRASARTRTAARLSSPKSCPTKLVVCRLQTPIASEVGRTKLSQINRVVLRSDCGRIVCR